MAHPRLFLYDPDPHSRLGQPRFFSNHSNPLSPWLPHFPFSFDHSHSHLCSLLCPLTLVNLLPACPFRCRHQTACGPSSWRRKAWDNNRAQASLEKVTSFPCKSRRSGTRTQVPTSRLTCPRNTPPSIHLADLSLTPLITSSSPSHLDALASLTSGALAAQSAAQRAHLGRPQRVMIEYSDAGPVVLQAYLDPRDVPLTSTAQPSSAQETPVPDHGGPAATVVAAAVDDNGDIYGDDNGDDDYGEEAEENDYDEEDNGDDEDPSAPRPGEAAPMLVGLVVASSPDDAREARRAASRLEKIGRDFQREWVLQGGSQTRDGTCARMTLQSTSKSRAPQFFPDRLPVWRWRRASRYLSSHFIILPLHELTIPWLEWGPDTSSHVHF